MKNLDIPDLFVRSVLDVSSLSSFLNVKCHLSLQRLQGWIQLVRAGSGTSEVICHMFLVVSKHPDIVHTSLAEVFSGKIILWGPLREDLLGQTW